MKRTRVCYTSVEDVEEGMVLAGQVQVVQHGMLRFSLPEGHALTGDNLRQLAAHHAEFVFVSTPDERSDEQIAVDAAIAARRSMEIFSGADLSDPTMAALFDQVLAFRSG